MCAVALKRRANRAPIGAPPGASRAPFPKFITPHRYGFRIPLRPMRWVFLEVTDDGLDSAPPFELAFDLRRYAAVLAGGVIFGPLPQIVSTRILPLGIEIASDSSFVAFRSK
jgi:hypothetical protein